MKGQNRKIIFHPPKSSHLGGMGLSTYFSNPHFSSLPDQLKGT